MRNLAFANALKSTLKSRPPGTLSVMDLGSGSGLLGVVADSLGSNRTCCVEFNDPLVQVSREILKENESNAEIASALSTELQIHKKYDVLVTEVFDCALLGEGSDLTQFLPNFIFNGHQGSKIFLVCIGAMLFCRSFVACDNGVVQCGAEARQKLLDAKNYLMHTGACQMGVTKSGTLMGVLKITVCFELLFRLLNRM